MGFKSRLPPPCPSDESFVLPRRQSPSQNTVSSADELRKFKELLERRKNLTRRKSNCWGCNQAIHWQSTLSFAVRGKQMDAEKVNFRLPRIEKYRHSGQEYLKNDVWACPKQGGTQSRPMGFKRPAPDAKSSAIIRLQSFFIPLYALLRRAKSRSIADSSAPSSLKRPLFTFISVVRQISTACRTSPPV